MSDSVPDSQAPEAVHDAAHRDSAHLPKRAAVLGVLLLGLGFVIGYGFHTVQSEQRDVPPLPPVAPTVTPKVSPPVVKGLRVSPNGKMLAFTAVRNSQQRAGRFVFELDSKRFSAVDTPAGWQDYIVQWSPDGRKLLFDREKIPRGVAETTSGLHEADVAKPAGPTDGATANAPPGSTSDRPLTPQGVLPPNEKSVAGFWTPDGALVVKTKREPKQLYAVRNGASRPIDGAKVTYYQNRAVREGGTTVYYVVRDLPNQPEQAALYRIEGTNRRQLTSPFSDVEWVYVSEDARWMIVCREAPKGDDWEWTLYRVSSQKASVVSTRTVPGDVSGVFWSPNRKYVLGASGESLWLIDIPTLHSRRLGTRTDWDADDAGWLPDSKSVIVAAKGKLWQVDVPSGAAREIWQFPQEFWS